MERHPIIWTAPQPLWKEATNRSGAERAAITAPAILRFATDDFMQEFLNVLATDSQRLGEYRAVKETWRGVLSKPIPLTPKKVFVLPFQRLAASRRRVNGRASSTEGRKVDPNDDAKDTQLKLYQPAHQRFYLVASSLVCQLAGLPDRKVDAGKHEQAGFVMRRLLPDKDGDEHAWVETKGGRHWVKCEEACAIESGEEILPLFAANHTQDDERLRRLFAGLIPAGKREAYLAAPTATKAADVEPGAVSKIAARKALLRKEVIEPWKALHAAADAAKNRPSIAEARSGIQVGSFFVLLDLALFLERYVKDVWEHIYRSEAKPQGAAGTLVDVIETLKLGSNLKRAIATASDPNFNFADDFKDALKKAYNAKDQLDQAAEPFDLKKVSKDWPDFLFPLADPAVPQGLPLPLDVPLPAESDAARQAEEDDDWQHDDAGSAEQQLDKLAALILRAMPADSDNSQPAVPLAARKPADALEGWFVIRCVYQRPACGPLHDDIMSERTEKFQLAGFFDPDAPARPIHIGLPLDTTPGGLRKFDRNTAFIISDTLCGQMKKFRSLGFTDLINGPGGAASPCKTAAGSFGTICSISIPIITLCAFILLMIMVSVLNIVFFWLPYFILCFPVPGLKAKK
jgi:hypothetical protein